MQAGDGDAGLRRHPTQVHALRGGQEVRLLAERERRDLQPVVAHGPRERALPLEGQLANDLVAERNAHRYRPLAATTKVSLHRPAPPMPTTAKLQAP